MNKHLKNVLKYFRVDEEGTHYIKEGYICVSEGFVSDYIVMISPNEDGTMRGYSMASDNTYVMNDDNIANLHVYTLNRQV